MGFLPDREQVVLRHLMERNAIEQPDGACILFENGEEWTYETALHEGYKAADVLSRQGLRRGENILIFLPNSQAWIRAWWGSVFLGAVVVPVNAAYRGEMLRHICVDSEAVHMVTTGDFAERVMDLGLNLNLIDPEHLKQGQDREPGLDAPIEPWDIHALMYTSGTTGPSKGVITPYLQSYMNGLTYRIGTGREDTFLIDLPLFHLSGMNLSYAAWAVGGRIALRTVFSASRYLEVIRECNVTFALLVGTMPAFLEAMPPKPDDADNPLRIMTCAPMPRDPVAFMSRFGIQELRASYGSTEMSGPVLTTHAHESPRSCGKIRPGVEIRLVDEHDIPVQPGAVGELIVRTDLPWEMNQGYWKRPQDTARAWRNGWFHSGDMFTCDEQGNYYFADRKKDAIRRRGENISSFEVEREVLACPDIFEAACVAVPGEFGEEEVKVFVVPREASVFDPKDLIVFLIPRMPHFMVPRFVETVEELPKTPTMRIKKYELRAKGNSEATWDREVAGISVKNS